MPRCSLKIYFLRLITWQLSQICTAWVKGKKEKQRGSTLWLAAIRFLLTELKRITLLSMGNNLKSNIILEKLFKTHIAHRRYLPIQAEIKIPHVGDYKTGHLEGEGGRRKEHLNWFSQWDWELNLRLAQEIASHIFTGRQEFNYV